MGKATITEFELKELQQMSKQNRALFLLSKGVHAEYCIYEDPKSESFQMTGGWFVLVGNNLITDESYSSEMNAIDEGLKLLEHYARGKHLDR
ncbi:hypothetical protein VCR15J2_390026 [Vibrio coralliirubri]|uniref:hypothetical protein n=1 Tax=Vibrio coralliirubri TaxID=1516159 RepID=UPI0006387280|nr:hypothetical protein [Vibrio coralliirubri]CDT52891.1 hypothetical protein VCR15J2_390026 [Vibrio coralliirubri]